jgi:hypothetical protein
MKQLFSAPRWRTALSIVRMAMASLAVAFLVYMAWHERHLLGDVLRSADTAYLLLTVMLWAATHVVAPRLSTLVLGGTHQPFSYAAAFEIHSRNIPARYIPGGIWHTVGRVADFHGCGFGARQLTAFVFLENMLAASVTLGAGGVCVAWVNRSAEWAIVGTLAALGGMAGFVFSWFVVNRWVLSRGDTISFMRYLTCIAVMVFFWIVAAAAFIAYLFAFPGWAASATWLEVGGAYLLSWGVGLVVVFAPQGIGIFETTFAALLPGSFGLGAVAVLVAGFRVMVLCADLTVWLASRSFWRRGR